ncbi:uncharacterized protein LOC108626905 [Ceratina calcarata]|uniref:Centromere protein L n=1 Tax=Ceratina calcarata TaxID=156304 RepID=A0AAJ7N8R0_9HYME|nr:uncharacterized protein LOC108626905 [Ceratina calcarata]
MTNTVESMQPSTSGAVHTSSTPRKGCQSFSLNVDHPLTGEPDDSLDELLHVLWTVSAVSVLFNFHQDRVHLKQYAKRLREEVANSLAQENVVYNAEVSVMKNKTSDSLDSPPIKIEVYSKTNGTTEGPGKCIYKGILLSCKNSSQKLGIRNAVRLPLLLCRGTRGAMGIVHKVLKHMFDCLITALPIGEDDLMWLVPIIIYPTHELYPKSTDELQMEYRIPELADRDSIVIKFKIEDVIKILKVIVDLNKNVTATGVTFTLDHIEKFREVLYTEMLGCARLQLGLCTLHKITLPGVTLVGNKMKSVKPGTMNRILLYMNDKAFDTLHAMNIDI